MKLIIKSVFYLLLLLPFYASCDDANIQSISIQVADVKLQTYLINNFDANGDKSISEEETAVVTKIDCRNMDIHSLEGLENFSALKELHCDHNQLSDIDLSQWKSLEIFSCDSNRLTALDIRNVPLLSELSCRGNQLKVIDTSKNVELLTFKCDDNKLVTDGLDIGYNKKLTYLSCTGNPDLAYIKAQQGLAIGLADSKIVKDETTYVKWQCGCLY